MSNEPHIADKMQGSLQGTIWLVIISLDTVLIHTQCLRILFIDAISYINEVNKDNPITAAKSYKFQEKLGELWLASSRNNY